MADNGQKERRQARGAPAAALRAKLNEAQLVTLGELERFGWDIQFVRHPLFQDPVPVLADGDRMHYAVLTPEGELDESPRFHFRQR